MNYKTYIEQTRWHGSYPAIITTDGKNYHVEYRNNYDGWKPNGIIVAHIMSDMTDQMPSFRAAEKIRKTVRAEWKKNAL